MTEGQQPAQGDKELGKLAGKMPYLGPLLEYVIVSGHWKVLRWGLALLFLFVLYPLLVPYLAAQLVVGGATFGGREHYTGVVRAAFRVREAADEASREANRELNARLDYFHTITFTGDPRHSRSYEIPIASLQRMEIGIEPGGLRSLSEKCAVPEKLTTAGAELMQVKVEGERLLAVTNQGAGIRDYVASAEDWRKWRSAGKGRLTLIFEPVEEIRKLCKGLDIEVRATIKVYKDLLAGAPRPAGAA